MIVVLNEKKLVQRECFLPLSIANIYYSVSVPSAKLSMLWRATNVCFGKKCESEITVGKCGRVVGESVLSHHMFASGGIILWWKMLTKLAVLGCEGWRVIFVLWICYQRERVCAGENISTFCEPVLLSAMYIKYYVNHKNKDVDIEEIHR